MIHRTMLDALCFLFFAGSVTPDNSTSIVDSYLSFIELLRFHALLKVSYNLNLADLQNTMVLPFGRRKLTVVAGCG
jgi:hypothetical protein